MGTPLSVGTLALHISKHSVRAVLILLSGEVPGSGGTQELGPSRAGGAGVRPSGLLYKQSPEQNQVGCSQWGAGEGGRGSCVGGETREGSV